MTGVSCQYMTNDQIYMYTITDEHQLHAGCQCDKCQSGSMI